eukprot:3941933-Rhodomonas_salina.5
MAWKEMVKWRKNGGKEVQQSLRVSMARSQVSRDTRDSSSEKYVDLSRGSPKLPDYIIHIAMHERRQHNLTT